MMKRCVFSIALLAAFCVIHAGHADETPSGFKEIFLAHTQKQDPASEPAAVQAAEFKRQVEALTGGTVKVGIFPDGQLGGNRDMAGLVSRGVIQSAFVTAGGLASLYPPIAVLEMPFVLSSRAAAYAVYDGAFGRGLAADIEKKTGLTVLGYGDGGGFFAISKSRRSLHSPSDMRGLRIRTVSGFAVLDVMIRSLGATPVNVSPNEQYAALATGLIDGEISPPMLMLSSHFDEVQKYVTLTEHLYVPTVWIFNRDAFARLTPSEQSAVRQAADAAVAAGRATARKIEAADGGIPALRRRMSVSSLSEAEHDAFKAVTQPAVAAEIVKTQGPDGARLLDAFLKAAEGR